MDKRHGDNEKRIAELFNQVDFGTDTNIDEDLEPGPHPWVPEYREEDVETVEHMLDQDSRIRMSLAKKVIDDVVTLADEPFHSQLIYEIEAIVNGLCTDKELGHDIENVLSVEYSVQNRRDSNIIDYRCDFKVVGDPYEVFMLKNEVIALLDYTDNYLIRSMDGAVIDKTDMSRSPNMYILRLEGEAVVNY